MIARIWNGAVSRLDGDAYAAYMNETGIAGYAQTPGNRGVWMLRRDLEGKTEFVMFTLWDSLEAVKAFAGEDYETAVFYPEDELSHRARPHRGPLRRSNTPRFSTTCLTSKLNRACIRAGLGSRRGRATLVRG
jgi:heme-degrading monooxygenase HmoA